MSMIARWLMRAFRKDIPILHILALTNKPRRGHFGEDYYTLRSMYFQGRPPPSVNMYWRRFAIKDIPLDDQEAFDLWLREKWYEKDAIIEEYVTNGRFPASAEATSETKADRDGYIETEVKLASWLDMGILISCWAVLALEMYVLRKVWSWMA
jgi:lysocardiolipin and lysophospholipid acyltransferase